MSIGKPRIVRKGKEFLDTAGVVVGSIAAPRGTPLGGAAVPHGTVNPPGSAPTSPGPGTAVVVLTELGLLPDPSPPPTVLEALGAFGLRDSHIARRLGFRTQGTVNHWRNNRESIPQKHMVKMLVWLQELIKFAEMQSTRRGVTEGQRDRLRGVVKVAKPILNECLTDRVLHALISTEPEFANEISSELKSHPGVKNRK